MDLVTLELIALALRTVTNSDATKKLAEAAAKAIADWDIHKVAEEAIVSGSGAIAQGPGGVAAGAGGVAVAGDITGPIHTGDGNVVVDADVVSGDKIIVELQDITDSEIQVAGRDIVKDTIEVARGVTVSYETAFEQVASSAAFVLNQLELSYNQTREQAQTWFRFSIIAAGLGFVLVGIGVVAVIFGQLY